MCINKFIQKLKMIQLWLITIKLNFKVIINVEFYVSAIKFKVNKYFYTFWSMQSDESNPYKTLYELISHHLI